MNKQIEEFITKNYQELINITKKITKNHNLSEDLLHEVIVQLYTQNIKLKKLDDNTIKYYIVAVIRTNWHSKTSPFYYKVKREFDKYQEFTFAEDSFKDTHYDFEREEILSILEVEFVELTWFHKSLLQMYIELGSLNKVAKKTGVPLTSISNYMRLIKSNIKTNIFENLKRINNGKKDN